MVTVAGVALRAACRNARDRARGPIRSSMSVMSALTSDFFGSSGFFGSSEFFGSSDFFGSSEAPSCSAASAVAFFGSSAVAFGMLPMIRARARQNRTQVIRLADDCRVAIAWSAVATNTPGCSACTLNMLNPGAECLLRLRKIILWGTPIRIAF